MIQIEVKKHSNFSIEVKSGISVNRAKQRQDKNEFILNSWIFLPNSIDVNKDNYKKEDFYKDVRTNIRLITPIFTLDEMISKVNGPFRKLQRAIDNLNSQPENAECIENYEYQTKMLMCIFKSAIRDRLQEIIYSEKEYKYKLIEEFAHDIKRVRDKYRRLKCEIFNNIIQKEQESFYLFGDDFLGNVILQYSFIGLKYLKNNDEYREARRLLKKMIEAENKHKRKCGYLYVKKDDDKNNSLVLAQRNILKKIIESDLFLQITKKVDGSLIIQFYYGLAAAIAMLFATIVSFIASQKYENYTFSLLTILVISYVFKDRIKDIMRAYLTSNMSKKYFDIKMKLNIRKQEIGEMKEAFDFVSPDTVPSDIMEMRKISPTVEADVKIFGEQIYLHRKYVKLSNRELRKYKEYSLTGINDISRYDWLGFTKQMDNATTPLYELGESYSDYIEFEGSRVYPIYIFFKYMYDGKEYKKGFRILLNRKGISEISDIT